MTAQQNYRVASFVSDKAIKAPCQAISVANLTLFGEQTVNTVPVIVGDRVLVNAQTVPAENGIYDVELTAWVRSADWDGDRDATAGTLVIVAGSPLTSVYQLDVTGTFTIGTSTATFTLLSTLDLAAVLLSTTTGEGASQVSIEDAAGLFTATTVEAALAELKGDIKYKTADQTVTSSATPVDDDDLVGWTLENGAFYEIEGYLSYNQSVGDFNFVLVPTNAVQIVEMGYWAVDSSAVEAADHNLSGSQPQIQITTLTDGDDASVHIKGVLQADGTTGGTLKCQWAQDTISANATTLKKGSWLSLRKIS